jgi:hypothetical protein
MLTGIEGSVVVRFRLEKGLNKIDVSRIKNGNYILHLQNDQGHAGKIITILH